MNFNSTEYIKNWNKKVENWQTDYLSYYRADVFTTFLKKIKSKNYRMQPEYLIEPYIGDIKNCSAVFINKNPGTPICKLQHYKCGSFILKGNAHKDYYTFSKKFPYLDEKVGGDWWYKRVEWVSRLANMKNITSTKNPFALEICPYHSNLFRTSDIIISDGFLNYTQENIIDPAEFANENSELGLILSVGNTFDHVYEKLGFEKVITINQDNFKDHNLRWYMKEKDKPTKNEFNLWQSKTGSYYLNYVHGSNYNKPPAQKWNFVEEYLFNNFIK